MTENKRFILTEQFNGLQGVTFVKDDCADVDTYYTVDGTVDLLNQFADENKQLKEDNDYLEKRFKEEEWHYNHIDEDRDVWKHKCQELEKENEQLKKELDKLKVVNEMLSIDFSNSEHELWRENEQLKADKQTLIDFIRKVFPKSHKHILEGFE